MTDPRERMVDAIRQQIADAYLEGYDQGRKDGCRIQSHVEELQRARDTACRKLVAQATHALAEFAEQEEAAEVGEVDEVDDRDA
jgi:hypothetical protein